jgi:hypothetical protein
MGTLHFVIGASGSGKTAAVHELARINRPGLRTFFFDRIGVPSEEERIAGWGSGGDWQRAMTIEWVRRVKPELASADAVLDGQTRPSSIAEACDIHAVQCYSIILIDCSEHVRRKRLEQRGQPELANEQMMEWGRYLFRETDRIGGAIINNDKLSVAETAAALLGLLEKPVRITRP